MQDDEILTLLAMAGYTIVETSAESHLQYHWVNWSNKRIAGRFFPNQKECLEAAYNFYSGDLSEEFDILS